MRNISFNFKVIKLKKKKKEIELSLRQSKSLKSLVGSREEIKSLYFQFAKRWKRSTLFFEGGEGVWKTVKCFLCGLAKDILFIETQKDLLKPWEMCIAIVAMPRK